MMTSQQINNAIRQAYEAKGYDKTVLALNSLVMAGNILPSDRMQALETLNFLHAGMQVYP